MPPIERYDQIFSSPGVYTFYKHIIFRLMTDVWERFDQGVFPEAG